ncbi:MAG: phosphate/phosphite/phosphonate ABC transporter substrate-binding protein [Gemmatales bacterium]|nr:phosphate/phosphite/phosphonate ABC transporter substrate-binding protein [Gemmatales bacterium]MDW8223409.1 PhnD/SsuA/transferrin family substrate-binding protein [Gemmatales bacterium]
MVRRMNRAAFGIALFAFVVSTLVSVRGSEKQGKGRVLRVGLSQALFRGSDPRLMLALMQPLGDLFSSQTGIACEFGVFADPADIGRNLAAGDLGLGIMHGIDYAWIREQYADIRPLLLCANETIALKAYILVREDSSYRGISDLKGKSIAFPKRSLNHCYLYTHKVITEAGENPAAFFGCSPEPANIDQALDWVFEGKAACTVVDGISFETYRQRKPGRAKALRVLHESGYYPTAAIIYSPKRLPEDIREKVYLGLSTAHERLGGRQLLTLWRLSAFIPPPPEYETLLVNVLKEHPRPIVPAAFIAEASPAGQ